MSKTLEASFGGAKKFFKKKNTYKQVDGDIVFRIVPPLTKFTDDPTGWLRFHSVVFGYKNLEGKARPFESPLVMVNKTKEIKVPCAATERVNSLKEKLKEAIATDNKPLATKLNVLVGQMGVYNIDNNHHMNVVGLDGNIGTFRIRHKSKLALDVEIAKLTARGINPLSLEDGRFFVFNRIGKGNETGFKVSVYQENIDVPGYGRMDRDVVHKITPELLARIEEEAANLDDIAPRLTSEEVAQVVAASDLLTGKSAKCNEFMDNRWKAARENKPVVTAPVEDDNERPEDDVAMGVSPAASVPAASKPAPIVLPNRTVVLPNNTAPTQTAPVAAAPPVQAPAKAQTQAQAIDDLSDDDFFAQLGVPQEARG